MCSVPRFHPQLLALRATARTSIVQGFRVQGFRVPGLGFRV